ncbi:Mur ligase [Myxozyma melibiosi]|uniref:Dihydrofolate synthetase n=1 Tax=Myxozyma melibiosi TaxID=54550 RepID=A0ABR1F210_9ASCO
MSINFGLSRITNILSALRDPHKNFRVFHVAGTNGKGSICAYLASILTKASYTTGRFTSPHLLYPRDSITIDGKAVSQKLFDDAYGLVKSVSSRIDQGSATNFELLTATAFEIFSRRKVDVAVIEVGMGGTHDATNVDYKRKGVGATIISHIAIDHQAYLGEKLTDIAKHKAGIMRHRVPCVLDGTNEPKVLKVLKATATDPSSLAYTTVELANGARRTQQYLYTVKFGRIRLGGGPLHGIFQIRNQALAIKALDVCARKFPRVNVKAIRQGIANVKWPGRLQILPSSLFTGDEQRQQNVILDGAHNVVAGRVAMRYLRQLKRQYPDQPVTWIVALSGDRDPDQLFKLWFKENDRVIAVPFKPVEMMPWVKPMDLDVLLESAAKLVGRERVIGMSGNILDVIANACNDNPDSALVVVIGSLYLVGDVLRGLVESGRMKLDDLM